jgi:hypothetical protein
MRRIDSGGIGSDWPRKIGQRRRRRRRWRIEREIGD